MTAPNVLELRRSHDRLHDTVDAIDDAVMARRSRLPGWTIGHVVAHLARNADSVVHRIEGARRGEQVERYAGGVEGRRRAIDDGAVRPAETAVADLRRADEAVERAFAAIGPPSSSVWEFAVEAGGGGTMPVSGLEFARWREVEIHHVDLGLGYEPADWPPGLVAMMLPRLVAGLRDRTADTALAAWLLGRGVPPELSPWG